MKDTERQTLAETFRNEQDDLHHKIDEWREWWKELSEFGEPRFGEMSDRLLMIRNLLEAHFQHEEQSGFFQEVAGIEPKYATRAQRLLTDHQEFIEKLRDLCSKLNGDEPKCEYWGDAKQQFEEFLNELESHEHEETALMNLWAHSSSKMN